MPASNTPVTPLAGHLVPSRPVPLDSLTPAPASVTQPAVASLLEALAQRLEQRGVAYCQWKGHWSAHRWAAGVGDVDLLVDHQAVTAFRRVVEELGFKLAYPVVTRQIPATESYFGHDPAVNRPLHLHVQYRLLLGSYWKPVYRIPVERVMLDGAVPGHPFRVPGPTHRYLVFVLRMMLRQVGRPYLSARNLWTSGIRIQLASLEAGSDREELARLFEKHLTSLDLPFFDRCVRSLQGGSGLLERALLPWQLHRRLRPYARRPSAGALVLAAVEKGLPEHVAVRISNRRMRLAGGGLVVGLVGGSGAGKSTCARELAAWLSPAFPTMRAHFEKAPGSLLTLLVGGVLELQHRIDRLLKRSSSSSGTIQLVHHLCTARDRFRLYEKAGRFGISGGIVVCEQYPVPENRQLVGPALPDLLPREPRKLARLLQALEASYYTRIQRPDLLLVLRLDPELAVARKADGPAEHIRARSRVIWDANWTPGGAKVVDAGQPLPEMTKHLKSVIWSIL